MKVLNCIGDYFKRYSFEIVNVWNTDQSMVILPTLILNHDKYVFEIGVYWWHAGLVLTYEKLK